MIRKITEVIDNPERDCIYNILGHLQLSLCVDIGAAAGHVTRRICLIGGDHTKVFAYEPFPSNHYYFKRNTEELTNDITLIKKAVSDRTGKSEFFVGSVVSGVEPGWQSYNGYSSVGYLTSASEANNSTLNSNSFKLLKLNSYLKPKI